MSALSEKEGGRASLCRMYTEKSTEKEQASWNSDSSVVLRIGFSFGEKKEIIPWGLETQATLEKQN